MRGSITQLTQLTLRGKMLIHSMTAFARHEAQGEWGGVVWELRSINHRYLEINLHLPDALASLELPLRTQIKNTLQRGKIDVYLRYQSSATGITKFTVNKGLMAQLLKIHNEISHDHELLPVPFAVKDIMQWPGILETQTTVVAGLEQAIMTTFTQALAELEVERAREGKALQAFLRERLTAVQAEISKIKACLPQILQEHRAKLLHRLEETKINVEPGRFEQEVVLFAQKLDVAEELERLEIHMGEIANVLQHGGAVGRRLDFLLQEANREANTLGAKSMTAVTTLVSVELKVLIEQMREQVQNIE